MVKALAKKNISKNRPEFRYRGVDPSRLENFSDAVFALAITLLLIATTPPQNFEQIKRFVWDIIPFGICISLFSLIWYQHFEFYYRYGLKSATIVAYNTLFLVIILFYVYPLKFLTQLSLIPIALLFKNQALFNELIAKIRPEEVVYLMMIYGLGAASVFWILALMYRHALKKKSELELTPVEIFYTKISIYSNVIMGMIPFLSVLLAIVFSDSNYGAMIAGFFYFTYAPVMFLFGNWAEKRGRKLFE